MRGQLYPLSVPNMSVILLLKPLHFDEACVDEWIAFVEEVCQHELASTHRKERAQAVLMLNSYTIVGFDSAKGEMSLLTGDRRCNANYC